MTAGLLLSVFGPGVVEGIGNVVSSFDFSKMDVTDNTRDDYLHVDLAPSFGELNQESVKMMDDELKIMISGTLHLLEKIPPKERTWDKVMSTMMQASLLEPSDGKVDRVDKLLKSGVNVFKFDGSPDAAIVKEVEGWFSKLISDEDVLRSTKIDIKVLAQIVAQTGATIDSFETLFYKNESHEKTMVDIGILRFPDISHPYFKVYRIKLDAWSQSKRVLMVQDDQNGITGEFNARNFRPRKEVIAELAEKTKKKAIEETESLWD